MLGDPAGFERDGMASAGIDPATLIDIYRRVALIRRNDDVEQEKNGIYHYDRTPKFDTKRIKEIFELIPSNIEKVEDLSY